MMAGRLAASGLVPLPIEDKLPSHTVSLIYRADSPMTPVPRSSPPCCGAKSTICPTWPTVRCVAWAEPLPGRPRLSRDNRSTASKPAAPGPGKHVATRGAALQCENSAGTVIDSSTTLVTPPSTSSRNRPWP